MFGERISIQNFLRASEIFLQERDHYSPSEQVLLRTMLGRLDAKVNKTKDTEDPSCSAADLQELKRLLQRKRDTST